jgi:hypothetical protein
MRRFKSRIYIRADCATPYLERRLRQDVRIRLECAQSPPFEGKKITAGDIEF